MKIYARNESALLACFLLFSLTTPLQQIAQKFDNFLRKTTATTIYPQSARITTLIPCTQKRNPRWKVDFGFLDAATIQKYSRVLSHSR